MYDEMTNIEQEKANHDMGRVAYQIWSGARSGGASRRSATLVTLAWFRAVMFELGSLEPDDDDVDLDEGEYDNDDDEDT